MAIKTELQSSAWVTWVAVDTDNDLPGAPIGVGATEDEAIADLLTQQSSLPHYTEKSGEVVFGRWPGQGIESDV
jgi:hypothetical protein